MDDVYIDDILPTTPGATQLRGLASFFIWVVALWALAQYTLIDVDSYLTHTIDRIPFYAFLLPNPAIGAALVWLAFRVLHRRSMDMAKGAAAFLGGAYLIYGTYLLLAHETNIVTGGIALAGLGLTLAFLMLRKVAAIEKACRDEQRAEMRNLDMEEPDFHLIDEPAPADIPVPTDEVDWDAP
jgi:hypothetical protein